MITYAKLSNKGGRDQNEDCVGICVKENNYCFVLADGLGGHGYGDVASQLVVDVITKRFNDTPAVDNLSAFIQDVLAESQSKLLSEQRRQNLSAAMKTTVVICLIVGNRVQWGYIGDSRLYHIKYGFMLEHTKDHSVPQMLVYAGEIKERDIRFHPDRNRLLSVMGEESLKLKFDLSKEYKSVKGRRFILCSDGFWEQIKEREMILSLRKSKNVNEWINMMGKLVEQKCCKGESDNFSAICVWCD